MTAEAWYSGPYCQNHGKIILDLGKPSFNPLLVKTFLVPSFRSLSQSGLSIDQFLDYQSSIGVVQLIDCTSHPHESSLQVRELAILAYLFSGCTENIHVRCSQFSTGL